MTLAPRNAIIRTAARLFQAEGAEAVGVDRIIAEAAVAKATFYRHFPSKDALVATVLGDLHAQAMATLPAGAETRAAETGEHPVLALFDLLTRWFSSPDFAGCVFIRMALERPAGDPSRNGSAVHKRALQDWIVALLESRDGLAPDRAREAARSVMILYDGSIIHARLHGDPSMATTAKTAARVVLRTYGVATEGDP